MDENKVLWNKCVEFHGHSCGGLTIGYKAALYAIELLDLKLGGGGNAGCLSADEEIVCISENDACGVMRFRCFLAAASAREICCSICGANRHLRFLTERPGNPSVCC